MKDLGREESISPDIKKMICGVIPERESELAQVYDKYAPVFFERNDQKSFLMETGFYGRVFFNNRTLYYIWLLGFASLKAMQVYPMALKVFRIYEPLQMELFSMSPQQIEFDKEFYYLIGN